MPGLKLVSIPFYDMNRKKMTKVTVPICVRANRGLSGRMSSVYFDRNKQVIVGGGVLSEIDLFCSLASFCSPLELESEFGPLPGLRYDSFSPLFTFTPETFSLLSPEKQVAYCRQYTAVCEDLRDAEMRIASLDPGEREGARELEVSKRNDLHQRVDDLSRRIANFCSSEEGSHRISNENLMRMYEDIQRKGFFARGWKLKKTVEREFFQQHGAQLEVMMTGLGDIRSRYLGIQMISPLMFPHLPEHRLRDMLGPLADMIFTSGLEMEDKYFAVRSRIQIAAPVAVPGAVPGAAPDVAATAAPVKIPVSGEQLSAEEEVAQGEEAAAGAPAVAALDLSEAEDNADEMSDALAL